MKKICLHLHVRKDGEFIYNFECIYDVRPMIGDIICIRTLIFGLIRHRYPGLDVENPIVAKAEDDLFDEISEMGISVSVDNEQFVKISSIELFCSDENKEYATIFAQGVVLPLVDI